MAAEVSCAENERRQIFLRLFFFENITLKSISSAAAFILLCKRASAIGANISLEAMANTWRDKLCHYFFHKTRQHQCAESRDPVGQSPPTVRYAPAFRRLAASHHSLLKVVENSCLGYRKLIPVRRAGCPNANGYILGVRHTRSKSGA